MKAGVSSMGEITVRKPSLIVISIPRPPNEPLVSIFISLYISGGMNELCGSREDKHAIDCTVNQLLGIDFFDVVFLTIDNTSVNNSIDS